MSFSFYEVYINALRAFNGMGFPFGADEDAAYIISWLELNNINGLKLLSNTIEQIDNNYNGTIKLDKKEYVIDLKNSSVLMKGPSLISYIESILEKKNYIEIDINNCPDPIFFIPLLYKIASNGIFTNLSFPQKFKKNKGFFFKKNLMLTDLSTSKIIHKTNKSKITFSTKDNLIVPNTCKKEISLNTIQNNLSKSLNPNIKHWKIIEKIAYRTFVPESDESRMKGAGGGDDND